MPTVSEPLVLVKANNIAELGYVLNPAFRGQGIAVEAAMKLLSIGFDYLGLERIEVKIIAENSASIKVAEKCGMKLEGIFRHYMLIKGQYRDIAILSILRSEYYQNNKAMDYSHFNEIKKSLF